MASIPAVIPDDAGLDETALIAAAKAGDDSAFVALVEPLHPKLLAYLGRLTGDDAQAEDLAQETLINAHRELTNLRRDLSFEGWVFRIARNQARMAWRRAKLIRMISLDWVNARPAPMLSPLHGADRTVACNEAELISTILADLSPTLRETLLLHDDAGFGTPEIAAILGVSLSSAEKRLSRARAEFRRRYLEADAR